MSLEDFRQSCELAPDLFHWQRRMVLLTLGLLILCVVPNPLAAWSMDSLYQLMFIAPLP